MLSLPGARVRALNGELGSHDTHSEAKKKKTLKKFITGRHALQEILHECIKGEEMTRQKLESI